MGEVDWDFVSLMPLDVADKILSCLYDPGDVLRACAVSRAWRDFVIANSICKRVCLRLRPELDRPACLQQKVSGLGFSSVTELEHLKKEHELFASRARILTRVDTETFHIAKRSEGLNCMESYSLLCESIPQAPDILFFTSDFCHVLVDSLEGVFQGVSPCKPSAKALRFYEGYSCFIRKATCIWKIVESEDLCSCVDHDQVLPDALDLLSSDELVEPP